ncbi:3-methyladenine DNA glycosylase [Quadrisphaera setariae]|uniref:3-methyladenine DNA glycosylase n=1 Tax=Quadrisphaera setariae TaxID=2593304 RepID=A0A5C8Z557_9ACTN|nr:3-methyladenine DNA glycosylase [Quadrisphaera setariae]TXR52747.1 3-methyladenine DNA glycosylase [Quadrisphaera setariae]
MQVADWRERTAAHEQRADALTAARRERRSRAGGGQDAVDPVDDFLYDYYSLRPGQLRRWHPGAGAVLVDAADAPHRAWRWYAQREQDGGVALDAAAFAADRGRTVATSRRLLEALRGRPPHLGCFGMHEWAMVYRSGDAVGGPSTGGASAGGRRHALPLRLGQAGADAVVEAHPLRCSHIDAFRFFTPEAVPRNAAALTRETQAETDQPGCVHVTMDVLRHAVALGPACPGELLLDCFEAARAAREVDMRASPYDVSGSGLSPIAVETRDGKVAYAAAQRELAAAAAPLRERLLRTCEEVLG